MKRHTMIAAASVALLSCAPDNWSPDELLSGKPDTHAQSLRRGQEAYTLYCVGCHGEQGDGQGPASRFLTPKPRDFRKGRVKFAAVPAGTLPRDEDLMRIITSGLAGTSMPAWNLLTTEERTDIIAYIKTFSDAWKATPGIPVPIKKDPFKKRPEDGVAEGEKVYHGLAACSSCHPAYATKAKIAEHMKAYDIPLSSFREAMYESVAKDSEWGEVIKPPDFLADRVKAGTTREDLVRVIAAGVGGTAMPSWGTSLSNEQLWGLAYYVESLVQIRDTKEASALKQTLLTQPEFKPPEPPPKPPEPPPASDLPDAGTGDGGAPQPDAAPPKAR